MNIESTINKIIEYYGLGEIIQKPKSISGGILHEIYKIETTSGSFAIKKFNSNLIKNIIQLEKHEITANYFLQKNIPTITALQVNNKIAIQIDENWFMVFPWIEGKVLWRNEITAKHAKIIGTLLAKIHQVAQNAQNKIISHCDLNHTNVIWRNGIDLILIDWEYAGEIDPAVDVLLNVLNWSWCEDVSIDEIRFIAMLNGYSENNVLPTISDETVQGYFAYCKKWLAFSRQNPSLKIDKNFTEKAIETVAKNQQKLIQLAQNLQGDKSE